MPSFPPQRPAFHALPAVYDDDRGAWQDASDLPDPINVCLRPFDTTQAEVNRIRERGEITRMRLWATIAVSATLTVWGVWLLCLVFK